MKTTRKQLVDFTIRLVKEVSKQNEDITIDYQNSSIHIWFHTSGASRNISLYLFNDLKTNKDKFKKFKIWDKKYSYPYYKFENKIFNNWIDLYEHLKINNININNL